MVKVAMGLGVILVGFLAFVSTRKAEFYYERSGLINAPAEKIFPYLSNLRMGALWSPYEKKDPAMKKDFKGEDGKVGSVLDFDGNREAGSGSLEILRLIQNEWVEVKLHMTKPIDAENLIRYQLTPEAGGTRFTWSMSGHNGFIGKLVSTLIDCEKMIAPDFEKGIINLKTLVESSGNVK